MIEAKQITKAYGTGGSRTEVLKAVSYTHLTLPTK